MLVRALYMGATRGLLRVVLSFAATFLSAAIVYRFSDEIANMGSQHGLTSHRMSLSLAFIALLIVIYLTGWIGTKIIGFAGLSMPNKILGMIFSFLQLALLVAGGFYAVTSLFDYINQPIPEFLTASLSYRAFNAVLAWF